MSGPRWEIKRNERGEVVDVKPLGPFTLDDPNGEIALVAQAQRETEEAIARYVRSHNDGDHVWLDSSGEWIHAGDVGDRIERGEHWLTQQRKRPAGMGE